MKKIKMADTFVSHSINQKICKLITQPFSWGLPSFWEPLF